MATAVLQALRIILPGLTTTIRSSLPRNWFASRLDADFAYVEQADIGLVMDDAFSIRRDDSFAAYSDLHSNWSERIDSAVEALAALRPTMLLSNVTYLSLAAAMQIGIPSIAFGPLNWADIFQFYFYHLPHAPRIHEQILEAYLTADVFLRTTPAMPMPDLSNSRSVGPIARIGRSRKSELRRKLGLGDDITTALLTLGGVPTKLDFSKWPRLGNVRVIVGPDQEASHPDVFSSENVGMSFIDMLASSDVVITKPGYGTVTESTCNGVPMLLLPRGDWPEAKALVDWLGQVGRMGMLSHDKLSEGNFLGDVEQLLGLPSKPIPQPTGVDDIADLLAMRLR